ncbi:hypothetical protein F5Y13DRAFT_150946 [Hypoxylon sp. FL1857]|nr:hypothetical protein F5Y13DRAFT_150946 [Hypoxylon sp. FL1857]
MSLRTLILRPLCPLTLFSQFNVCHCFDTIFLIQQVLLFSLYATEFDQGFKRDVDAHIRRIEKWQRLGFGR